MVFVSFLFLFQNLYKTAKKNPKQPPSHLFHFSHFFNFFLNDNAFQNIFKPQKEKKKNSRQSETHTDRLRIPLQNKSSGDLNEDFVSINCHAVHHIAVKMSLLKVVEKAIFVFLYGLPSFIPLRQKS